MMSNNFNSNPYFAPNGQVPRGRGVRLLPKGWVVGLKRSVPLWSLLLAVVVLVGAFAGYLVYSGLAADNEAHDAYILDLREYGHTVSNELTIAIGYLESGDTQTANAYVGKAISEITAMKELFDSGWPLREMTGYEWGSIYNGTQLTPTLITLESYIESDYAGSHAWNLAKIRDAFAALSENLYSWSNVSFSETSGATVMNYDITIFSIVRGFFDELN